MTNIQFIAKWLQQQQLIQTSSIKVVLFPLFLIIVRPTNLDEVQVRQIAKLQRI
jgi:hypothetical protein